MLGRNKTRTTLAALSAVAAVCFFSSCASTPSENPSSDSKEPTDSALLLDGSKDASAATPVNDAFADLEPGKEKAASGAPATEVDSSSPYYSPVGGESLRRVAYTLYSDKAWAVKLLEKNPELKGVKRLTSEQKVFFDMGAAKPDPTYLTKDLLDRYASPLADRLTASVEEKGLAKKTVTLERGETLQQLSMRLYGTHRYWTEIYLVNHDKISNYDKVKPGMTLAIVERAKVASSASTAPLSSPVPVAMHEEPMPAAQPAPVAVPTQPEPMRAEAIQPVVTPQAVVDPIPETPALPPTSMATTQPSEPPPALEPAPLPPAVAPVERTVAPEPVPQASHAEISSSNAVTRPAIYAALVLLILGAGFYYTRSPKKPKGDMLDITSAESASRPKLSTKDSQKHGIG